MDRGDIDFDTLDAMTAQQGLGSVICPGLGEVKGGGIKCNDRGRKEIAILTGSLFP